MFSGEACPAGQFSPYVGAIASCSLCSPGTFSSGGGAATCSNCSVGFACFAGSTNATAVLCSAGYACPAGSTSPQQSMCPAGQYSGAGSGVCAACPGPLAQRGLVTVTGRPASWECMSLTLEPVPSSALSTGSPIAGLLVLVSSNSSSSGFTARLPSAINGVSSGPMVAAGAGRFTFQYSVPASQADLLWSGLSVDVGVVHPSGMAFDVQGLVAPGAVFANFSVLADGSNLYVSAWCDVHRLDGLTAGAAVVVPQPAASPPALRVLARGTQGFADATTTALAGSSLLTTPPSDVRAVACGDLTTDGADDVLVLLLSAPTVRLLVNSSSGLLVDEALPRGFNTSTSSPCTSVSLGDVTGDGHLDVLIVGCPGSASALMVNNGSGFFAPASASRVAPAALGGNVTGIFLDANGDGHLDALLCSVDGTASHRLLMNNGSGYFVDDSVARGIAAVAGPCSAITVGDVNQDGQPDVAFSSPVRPTRLLINHLGFFTSDAAAGYGLAVNASSLVMSDVDWSSTVDVLVGAPPPLPAQLLLNSGSGWFDDYSSLLLTGAPQTSAGAGALLMDTDGDGDADVPALQRSNPRAHGGSLTSSVLVVRVVGRSGALTQQGATVVLRRSLDGAALGSRVVGQDGGSSASPGSYDVHFGIPSPGTPVDLTIVFVGGRVVNSTVAPALGAILPWQWYNSTTLLPRVLSSRDVPLVSSVSVAPAGGVLGIGGSVNVSFTLVGPEVTMGAGPGMAIHGVNVSSTFAVVFPVAGNRYAVVYTVREGDGDVAPGALASTVSLWVVDPRYPAAGAFPLTLPLVASTLAVDATRPEAVLTCGPVNGTYRNNAVETLCVACGPSAAAEPWGCDSFWYTVNDGPAVQTRVPSTVAPAPATNITLSGLATGTVVRVAVWAVDLAGNVGAPTRLTWSVDLVPPVTTVVRRPSNYSSARSTSFSFACSKANCTYFYSLDGSAMAALSTDGGATNGTGGALDDPSGSNSSVRLVAAPGRLTASPAATFVVNVTGPGSRVQTQVDAALSWSDVTTTPSTGAASTLVTINVTAAGAGGRRSLRLRSMDASGHVQVAPTAFVWSVLPLAPSVRWLSTPPVWSPEPLGTASFVLSASTVLVSYEYRYSVGGTVGALDPWRPSSSAVVALSGLTGGVSYTLEARAVDDAGNVGASITWSWATGACPLSVPVYLRSLQAQGVSHSEVAVYWTTSGQDTGDTSQVSTVEYTIDGAPTWTRTSQQVLVLSRLGGGARHNATVRVAVPSGCESLLAAQQQLSVSWVEYDPAPGAPSFVTAPSLSTPSAFGTFALSTSAMAELSYFQYSLDALPWTPCDSTVEVGPLRSGPHTMAVRTVDVSGTVFGPTISHAWTVVSQSGSALDVIGLRDGSHTLAVAAHDLAGNVEPSPQVVTWIVSTIPPATTAALVSPQVTNQSVATVSLSCSSVLPPRLCTYCWTVRGSFAVQEQCGSNTTLHLSYVRDGAVTVSAHAVDAASNPALSPVVVSWTWDTVAPNVTSVTPLALPGTAAAFVVLDSNTFVASSANVGLLAAVVDATDVHVTVAVDGEAYSTSQPAGAAFALSGLREGAHVVSVTAVDGAGNVDVTPWVGSVVVVTVPPGTVLNPAPPAVTALPSISFVVEASGPNAGWASSFVLLWDGPSDRSSSTSNSSTNSSSPLFPLSVPASRVASANSTLYVARAVITIAGVDSGLYSVSARAVDILGNTDPVGANASMVVDLVPPTAACVPYFQAISRSSLLTVAVRVIDALSVNNSLGRVRVDGGPWVSLPTSGSGLSLNTSFSVDDGMHDIECAASDGAGNAQLGPYHRVSVLVDVAPPVVAVTQHPEPYTSNATAVVCVSVRDIENTTVTMTGSGDAVVVVGTLLLTPGAPMGLMCGAHVARADGGVQVTVHARDGANNSAMPVTVSWILDRVAPSHTAALVPTPSCRSHEGVTVCNSPTAATFSLACSTRDGTGFPESPCRVQWSMLPVQPTPTTAGCSYPSSSSGRVLVAPDVNASMVAWNELAQDPLSPAPPLVTVDGLYQLLSRPVDGAQNAGPVVVVEWYVDTAAPARPSFPKAVEAVTFSASTVVELQLPNDNSPGQTTFWYTLTPAVNGSDALSQVPQPPVPNSAVVQLTINTVTKGVSYVLSVWSMDQAGWRSSLPATATWTTISTAPVVSVLRRPAQASGLLVAQFAFVAVWGNGSGLTGMAADATFQMGLSSPLVPPCADSTCNGTCVGSGCVYNFTLPSSQPAAYTLQASGRRGRGWCGSGCFRCRFYVCVGAWPEVVCRCCMHMQHTAGTLQVQAMLGGVAGAATPVSWSFQRCTRSQFAVIDDADGAVTCKPCPLGADCATQDLTTQREIVSLPGYWASSAGGLTFYVCPIPAACLPGENGTRTTCAPGYGSIACSVCLEGYFQQVSVWRAVPRLWAQLSTAGGVCSHVQLSTPSLACAHAPELCSWHRLPSPLPSLVHEQSRHQLAVWRLWHVTACWDGHVTWFYPSPRGAVRSVCAVPRGPSRLYWVHRGHRAGVHCGGHGPVPRPQPHPRRRGQGGLVHDTNHRLWQHRLRHPMARRVQQVRWAGCVPAYCVERRVH
jgi:hypothetical protein